MNRRHFVAGALAIVATLAAAGVGWLRRRRVSGIDPASSAHGLAPRLREEFHYLSLSDGAVDAFVRDFDDFYGERAARVARASGAPKRFLLSTDFFQNGADESHRVAYVAFYHPYRSPCYQPLARL